ncbi:MAG: methyltransferase domain-containing protein [Thermoguttaceae bacterium]
MGNRWDVEWRSSVSGRLDLSSHESWPWVQRTIKVPARVLEAGCGIAHWVAFLDSQGYEAYGVDYSQVAIDTSLSVWPGLRLSVGDLRSLPYEAGFFDGIVSFGAIEHDVNGPDAALAEMYRVLRPGGTFYCTVPCINTFRRLGGLAVRDWIIRNRNIRRLAGRSPECPFFEYVYRPSEYANVLAKAGFEVLELVPANPHNLSVLRGVRRDLTMMLYRRWPWSVAHMVGAVCRKP